MLSVIKATKYFFEVQRKRRNEKLTKKKKIEITKKTFPLFLEPQLLSNLIIFFIIHFK
jgi:hypothetical protein